MIISIKFIERAISIIVKNIPNIGVGFGTSNDTTYKTC